ncbi:MAG: transporter [Verrucomicrobiaceae bacterium]|nr:MAG: transporter [Verrucomicrobiaceae bacterium]
MSLERLLFLPLLLPTLHAAEFRRELSADRPDTTESPFTVEAGKFQLESSLWAFGKDGSDETWTLGEMNLKAGLTAASDLQLVLRPWIHETSGGETNEGFGDIELRLKHNLWGNDGGKTAGALMPYVSIPSHTAVSSGEWEGGLIFPVSIGLTDRLGLGLQVEAARAWEGDSGEYGWDFLHSAVLGISVTDKLGIFIEYVGVTGDGPYEATANVGFTWASTENLQWDIAVGVGLNDAAEDLSVAQGVTFRF